MPPAIDAMERWPRQILFGDVDAMFASAAIVADPSLNGKLVAVGSPPPRGIITAANYAARRVGIKAPMPTSQALRLCPALVVVPLDRPLYRRLHDQMREVTRGLFPATAWSSIDEFYADVTDLQSLYPDPHTLGRTVRDALFDATGLRCTVAITTGKVISKIAADAHKPDGLAVVAPGHEAAFLAAQSVRAIPGIGPTTGARLEQLGVRVIGDFLEPRFETPLRRICGARLHRLQSLARGLDDEPVVVHDGQKSLSHETTFDHDTDEIAVLEAALRGFLSSLTHELRVEGLAARACTVKLKDARFNVTTRHRRFSKPLNYDPPMWRAVADALRTLARSGTSYRLVGLALSELTPTAPGLFDGRQTKAMAALDDLIDKHGAGVVRLGGLPES